MTGEESSDVGYVLWYSAGMFWMIIWERLLITLLQSHKSKDVTAQYIPDRLYVMCVKASRSPTSGLDLTVQDYC